jgi:hypothetical protein
MYEEKIYTEGNEFLILGDLFHQCLDKAYKGESFEPVLSDYEAKVKVGVLSTESGMLEDVVKRYLDHYELDEEIIASEYVIEEEWEDGDTFKGIIDRIVSNDNIVTIRDTKTTQSPLSYTTNQVKFNTQLLTYCSLVQENLNMVVDEYEIDEVRLAMIQPVPINANGKPTADKKRLGLVLYEDYRNKLCEMGLENEPEYAAILDYLEKRGHPLFKRTKVQLLDQNILASNIQDIAQTYEKIKLGHDNRVRGKLCEYCAYQELCNLDFYMPDDDSRAILINKLKKQS